MGEEHVGTFTQAKATTRQIPESLPVTRSSYPLPSEAAVGALGMVRFAVHLRFYPVIRTLLPCRLTERAAPGVPERWMGRLPCNVRPSDGLGRIRDRRPSASAVLPDVVITIGPETGGAPGV